jgi:hypothetical protein
MTTKTECFVHNGTGVYTTSQVRGCRASANMNARAAAESLGRKLYGPSFLRADEVQEGNHHTTRWVLQAEDEEFASVAPDGSVHFGAVIPILNTALARGPRRALHAIVGNAVAHEGYSGEPWLHGVHDGLCRAKREEAILAWLAQQAAALKPKHSLGVTFETSIRRAAL